MTVAAVFDENDHTVTAGWATHQERPMFRWRLRCARGSHVLPAIPAVPDGIRPDNCARCPRCRAFLKWYRVDQHRYGSLDRDVWRATIGRRHE